MIGFDILHVLDLGVTRTMVHRVIKLLPFMCVGARPLAGSLEATKRLAFERLKFMVRRCRACKADPGYAVGEDEKQSSYSAKQQRDGVCILPFIFAGLFGRHGGNAPPEAAVLQHHGDAAEGAQSKEDDDGYDADDDEDVDHVKRGFTYDWAAYRAKLGDTPLHEAVTALFAEYAALYMRVAGQVGASAPPLPHPGGGGGHLRPGDALHP
eukprot:contig_25711_g6338